MLGYNKIGIFSLFSFLFFSVREGREKRKEGRKEGRQDMG